MVALIATVVIKDDEGRVLLVKENGLWAVPGGKVEKGERVIEAAEREIREETGYQVNITSLARVYELKKAEDYNLFFVFRAKIVKGVREGDLGFRWFNVDEIKSLNTYPETYILLKGLEKKSPKSADYPFEIHFYF
ncbi:MAG: NUDIX domain-containing protein [Candidatus Freyarchaeum deiterrae]